MSPDQAMARQGGSHWAIAAGTAAKAMSPPSTEPASRRRSAVFIPIVIVCRSQASSPAICANKCGAVTARL